MKNLHLLSFCVGLLLAMAGTEARADSGLLFGRFMFWNKNGNYCLENCTGAHYVGLYDQAQPVKNAKVFVFNNVATWLGTGATDDNGDFMVAWSYPGTLPAGSQTYVFWIPEHRDGRFSLRYSDGVSPWYWTAGFTPANGAWVPLGTYTFGSSAGPDPFANAYFAAEMQWRHAFAQVNVLAQNFTGLEIRGFVNDIPGFMNGPCPNSCARGSTNRIQLDANAALTPQARVMHEMGHIAVYKAKTFQQPGIVANTGAFCYPATTGNCGWSANEAEWGFVAFNEALASFAADAALYLPNATSPRTCLSAFSCPANEFNIETSSTSCPGNQYRWPLSEERYLWDVYDSVNDGETVSEGWVNYWRMFQVLSTFPAGTGANQADEPWNSAFTAIDQFDGRASAWYSIRYSGQYGASTFAPWLINCLPP